MSNPFNEVVGKRIHQARKRKRMSMKELGELVNLHESTISRYEKGMRKALDIDTLKEFAKALDVPPEYLTDWGLDRIKDSENIERFREFTSIGLTDGEIKELYNYAKYIISKRK